MSDSWGKSICAWCGEPIQNMENLMELKADTVIHETCWWKHQAKAAYYWSDVFLEKIEELEHGMNRTVKVNRRARP